MSDHISLIVVELLTVSIGSLKIYSKWSRHWCGYRLLPRVIVQLLLPMFVVAAFYTELFHVGMPFFTGRYRVVVAAIAAQFADAIVGRLLGSAAAEGVLDRFSVARRIADKKLAVVAAITIERDPRALLVDVIRTSALAWREQENLIVRLHAPPNRDDVYRVIDAIGLAHVKLFVTGGKYAARNRSKPLV